MITLDHIGSLGVSLLRNPRRRAVVKFEVTCEICGALGMRRSSRATESMAHWLCLNVDCAYHWKEPTDVRQA